jgi:hypothetical protein
MHTFSSILKILRLSFAVVKQVISRASKCNPGGIKPNWLNIELTFLSIWAGIKFGNGDESVKREK